MEYDTAFQIASANIRFGDGTTSEVGMDLSDLQAKRTMLVMDPALVPLPTGQTVVDSLKSAHVDFTMFDRVSVEPTDESFRQAAKTLIRRFNG